MSPLVRRLSSELTRVVISPRRRALVARARELRRRVSGAPHRVRYFHQVDDPYSHLAAQALAPLCARYDIVLEPLLAAPELGPNLPEPELLAAHALRDCALVAPHYGLEFPESGEHPAQDAIRSVEGALAGTLAREPEAFSERAVALGRALWSGEAPQRSGGEASADETRVALERGSALRRRLGHYSGAMFEYAGEWYWGVDRLHHLEARLAALGAAKSDTAARFPRPGIATDPAPNAKALRLEIFASLRSPYSAIGFEPALALAERSGVAHELRPVLPMVMRGVPVPMVKAMYIVLDTHREAESLGMPFGRLYDPIGEPVRRGFSLWPWARDQGRGDAFFAEFVRAAFADGVDTGSDAGMRRVVERAGLDWGEARPRLGASGWQAELEANRLAMLNELGVWGVPSFRLRGPVGEPDLHLWGQDRLWLLSREIQRRGAATA